MSTPETPAPGSEHLEHVGYEAFVELIALGESPTYAYRECVSPDKVCTITTARVEARRLLRNPLIFLRLDYLKAQNRKTVEERFGLSRDWLVQWLMNVLETPVGDITVDHELAQEWKAARKWRGQGDHAEEWEEIEVKMPNKLQAAALLFHILVYKAPEKLAVTHDVSDKLASLIANIRTKRQLLPRGGVRDHASR
jgi:hypothetical protein